MIARLQHRNLDLWQLALTLLLTPFVILAIVDSARRDVTSAETLFLSLSLVVLLARTRYPEAALIAQGAIVLATARFTASSVDTLPNRAFLEISLLSFSSLRDRSHVYIASGLVLLTVWASLLVEEERPGNEDVEFAAFLGMVAWTAASAGIGSAVRAQRQYVRAIRDNAERERRNRAIEMRQTITEERLRIARELHDAVAHHIAVVSMFLGLARTTARTSPEKTEETLASAQEATRSVLAELQQILHLLREPIPAGVEGGIDPPVPGLADLDALIAGFRTASMAIDVEQSGQAGVVSTQTGSAIYRLVQEALTNANKHGTGTTRLRMSYSTDRLAIEVSNAISPHRDATPRDGAGLGLIGMGERVRLLGGSLAYGADGETFRLSAAVPLERARAATEAAVDSGSQAS